MKQRKLVIGLLIMVALVVSTFTFAFWASSVNDADGAISGTIQVGTGKAVTTSVILGGDTDGEAITDLDNLILVPVGRIPNSTPAVLPDVLTDSIVLNFTVAWDEDADGDAADGALGTLTVDVASLTIGDVADFNAYLSIVITYTDGQEVELNGDAVAVVVTITLLDTISIEDYADVAGQVIAFDLTFDVVAD